MANSAIFLCALIIAGGANAGVISGAVEKAYQKIDEIIDNATFATHEVIMAANKLAAEWSEKLAEVADEEIIKINQKHQAVYEEMLYKRTGKTLVEITEYYDTTIPTQCKVYALALRQYIFETAEDTSVCVKSKIVSGTEHFAGITKNSDDIIMELSDAKNKAKNCIENIDGVTSTVGAMVCLSEVGVKASWISIKKIPEITTNIAKLAWTVGTFPSLQGECTSVSGLKSVPDTLDKHIGNLEVCIKEGTVEIIE